MYVGCDVELLVLVLDVRAGRANLRSSCKPDKAVAQAAAAKHEAEWGDDFRKW